MSSNGNGSEHPYSRHFDAKGVATRYEKKFAVRIDRVRHQREENILSRWCTGSILDCSIGIGRFIGRLPAVTSYTGLDFSQEFLAYCRERFPDTPVRFGDLLKGIDDEEGKYDTVLCLRTLSSLGKVDFILGEMKRVAKKGGRIIFDYGTQSNMSNVEGVDIPVSAFDIEKIREQLALRELAAIPVDAIALWIKESYYASRIDERILKRVVPDSFLEVADRFSSKLKSDRTIYVWEK